MEVGRLQKEDIAKEEEKLRKAQAKAAIAQARPIRLPKDVLDRVVGWAGWAEWQASGRGMDGN